MLGAGSTDEKESPPPGHGGVVLVPPGHIMGVREWKVAWSDAYVVAEYATTAADGWMYQVECYNLNTPFEVAGLTSDFQQSSRCGILQE